MTKKKDQNAVEEQKQKEQESPQVEVQEPKVKKALIILIDENGAVNLRDGKHVFSNVEENWTDKDLKNVVDLLHNEIKLQELVEAVRSRLAQSLLGGNQ